MPSHRIVPVFRLTGTLHRDADIGLLYLARGGKIEARHLLVRVDAENVASRAMQADIAEVAGLVIHIATEEETEVVAGVGLAVRHVFLGYEGYLGVLVAQEVGKVREVLVEGVSKRSDAQLCGRTSQNKMVVFDRGDHKAGEYVKVRITGCSSATLFGEEVSK